MTKKSKASKSSQPPQPSKSSLPSPLGVTVVPAAPPQPTPAITPKEATPSASSPLDSAQVYDKAKGKAITDVKGWTVEDVANWLKSEGFHKDICDKFIGNKIDGEVLIDLNDEILKSGMGIVEYGPRHKIMNAIKNLSPGDEHLSKRMRFGEDFEASDEFFDFKKFWNRLWVDKVNPVEQMVVSRDPDPIKDIVVPETMKVLRGVPSVLTPLDIFVRDEYDSALSAITQSREVDMGIIVVGHPGIGKTMMLYYLLAIRLLNQRPTIFQYRQDILLVFDGNGVSTLSPEAAVIRPAVDDIWALVDCNQSLEKPAPSLVRQSSPAFLVVTSSPRSIRWADVQHYRPPAPLWFMQPFTLVDLIQARQLQVFKRQESDIQDFFEAYGPSARDCFAFCHKLDAFHLTVESKVAQLGWDTLTTALTKGEWTLDLNAGSHKILLIEPVPGNAYKPQIRIISKAVSQVVWAYDSIHRGRNHRQLYRTLRLEPKAKGFSGTLLEPAFHDRCVKGITLTMYPMTKRSQDPRNYIFVNYPRINAETLVLPRQTRVFFHRKNPVSSFLADHYYQPSHGSQSSYGSFIFDPTLSQITTFQVSNGETHDFKPLGICALCDLATELHVKDLKLRCIIAVPDSQNSRITCPVDRKMYDDLHLEMYTVEVTENELYDD